MIATVRTISEDRRARTWPGVDFALRVASASTVVVLFAPAATMELLLK